MNALQVIDSEEEGYLDEDTGKVVMTEDDISEARSQIMKSFRVFRYACKECDRLLASGAKCDRCHFKLTLVRN